MVSVVIPPAARSSLPNTKPLTEEGNLSEKQVAGMHKYLDRELAASSAKERAKMWKVDGSSPEAYNKSVEPNRERLRKMLGSIDERVAPKLAHGGVISGDAVGTHRGDRGVRRR